MKTKYQSLIDFLNEKRTVTGLYSSLVRKSLTELLGNGGWTRTGYSECRAKGWKSKRIWTGEVLAVLHKLNITCISGNNAPRGGANGEFVQVTCKAFVKQSMVKRKQLDDLKRIAEKEQEARREARMRNEQIKKESDIRTQEFLRRSEVVDYIKNYLKMNSYNALGQLNGPSRHLLSIDVAKSFPQFDLNPGSISRVLKTNIAIKKLLTL